jgi:hypothetical protein
LRVRGNGRGGWRGMIVGGGGGLFAAVLVTEKNGPHVPLMRGRGLAVAVVSVPGVPLEARWVRGQPVPEARGPGLPAHPQAPGPAAPPAPPPCLVASESELKQAENALERCHDSGPPCFLCVVRALRAERRAAGGPPKRSDRRP